MRRITFVCIGALLAGCTYFAPPYSIGLVNGTSAKLTDVYFDWEDWRGGHRVHGGIMVEGASASGFGMPRPIPERGTVQWRTPDGSMHSQVISVAPFVKNEWGFDGTVWLEINPSGVLVVPLPKYESVKLE